MIKKMPDKFWFPFWVDKWIFGSMRLEFEPEERSVWVDLMALATKDNGYIRANEETPYLTKQLAGLLVYDENFFDRTIQKFIDKGKLTRDKEGILYIAKYEDYKLSKVYKRVLKHREMQAEEEAVTPSVTEETKSVTYIKSNQIKSNHNKSKEEASLTPLGQQIFNELKKFGKLPGDLIETVKYISELAAEFPSVDSLEEIKKKIAHWKDHPLKKKSNVHLQLRNWFRIGTGFETENRQEKQVGRNPSKEESKRDYEKRKNRALEKVKGEVITCHKCKSVVDAAEFCPSCGEEMVWRFL